MKKRVLALLLAGAFVMQSSAALALELDVSEDVIEEDIVLTEDTEEDSGLVLDETAPESEDMTVEDDVQSITVQDVPTSGTCGTDVNWAYADGTLTISGEGAMDDYDYDVRPWWNLRESITKVVVEDGVTAIGNYAFFELGKLKTATLGKGVKRIGASAFYDCINLGSINIPDGVTVIESEAFAECRSLKALVLPESVQSLGGDSLVNISGLTLTVRNPKCVFNNPNMRSGTIRGHEGSTAETYANSDSHFTFVAIHIWDNGTVKTAPTCTEKGVKTCKCKYCAKTKTEDIDPINHKWGEWEVITPATCTEDGVETRT
ncbi:MAG: leucine-rich repeat domain-containing protein, partial [Clostridiales bacterium]|nr:leucine-rich repeat domain-containing protein [Clostridiales bacterium]